MENTQNFAAQQIFIEERESGESSLYFCDIDKRIWSSGLWRSPKGGKTTEQLLNRILHAGSPFIYQSFGKHSIRRQDKDMEIVMGSIS